MSLTSSTGHAPDPITRHGATIVFAISMTFDPSGISLGCTRPNISAGVQPDCTERKRTRRIRNGEPQTMRPSEMYRARCTIPMSFWSRFRRRNPLPDSGSLRLQYDACASPALKPEWPPTRVRMTLRIAANCREC